MSALTTSALDLDAEDGTPLPVPYGNDVSDDDPLYQVLLGFAHYLGHHTWLLVILIIVVAAIALPMLFMVLGEAIEEFVGLIYIIVMTPFWISRGVWRVLHGRPWFTPEVPTETEPEEKKTISHTSNVVGDDAKTGPDLVALEGDDAAFDPEYDTST